MNFYVKSAKKGGTQERTWDAQAAGSKSTAKDGTIASSCCDYQFEIAGLDVIPLTGLTKEDWRGCTCYPSFERPPGGSKVL